jgi:ribonucleoside-diphosphate reductase alpha chain
VGSKEMLTDYFYMTKMGIKTRYYVNSKTSDGVELGNDGAGCGAGGCTL